MQWEPSESAPFLLPLEQCPTGVIWGRQCRFPSRGKKAHGHSSAPPYFLIWGSSLLFPSAILYGYRFGINWNNFFGKYSLQIYLSWHFFSHTKPFLTISTMTPIKLNFSVFTYCPLPPYFCSCCSFTRGSIPSMAASWNLLHPSRPFEMPASGWWRLWYALVLKSLHPSELHRHLLTS